MRPALWGRATSPGRGVIGRTDSIRLGVKTNLDTLAAQFEAGDIDSELVAEYEALADDDNKSYRISEVESELVKQIGFHRSFDKADDFVMEIIRQVRDS